MEVLSSLNILVVIFITFYFLVLVFYFCVLKLLLLTKWEGNYQMQSYLFLRNTLKCSFKRDNCNLKLSDNFILCLFYFNYLKEGKGKF